MKTVYLWSYFLLKMVTSFVTKIKINVAKRKGDYAEADRLVYNFTSNFAKGILDRGGVKVNLKGKENLPKETCVFVANHQGIFDMITVIAYLDRAIGFVAKKEASKLPIVSSWMKEMHCVFLDRKNAREGLKTINEAIENVKKGHSMFIFPEGTRSRGDEMGEFKKGSMRLAVKSEAPIVPISIDGTYKILEANNGKFRSEEVTLTIGKPIYTKGLNKEELDNLASVVRNVIASNLEEYKQFKRII